MKSMLIIDSSEILARIYRELFEKRGWKVFACLDRRSALDSLAGDERFDAVLLSSKVPGSTGAGIIKFIRSLEHRRTTTVVLVTAGDSAEVEAYRAGADEVITRPLNPYALIWAVDKHVS